MAGLLFARRQVSSAAIYAAPARDSIARRARVRGPGISGCFKATERGDETHHRRSEERKFLNLCDRFAPMVTVFDRDVKSGKNEFS
ncbi:hypothetical protein [Streptomyces sp. NPDC094466]|uniref:hypothetical protein n=1 Tax=Streptomyces sp. NPDC094466 TaxID=3366065 RepID=UPI0037FDAC27